MTDKNLASLYINVVIADKYYRFLINNAGNELIREFVDSVTGVNQLMIVPSVAYLNDEVLYNRDTMGFSKTFVFGKVDKFWIDFNRDLTTTNV